MPHYDQSNLVVGPVAQRLELTTHNRSVPGSNPGRPIHHVYYYSTSRFLTPWYSHYVCVHCCVNVDLHDIIIEIIDGWQG